MQKLTWTICLLMALFVWGCSDSDDDYYPPAGTNTSTNTGNGSGGSGSSGGSGGSSGGTTASKLVAPCHFTSNQASGFGTTQASAYARQIISLASQLGGVSTPRAALEVAGMRNAYYQPTTDTIAYDPYWLINFNQQTGFVEAGDSIIYHEVGHMWANKTGRSASIGSGTVDQQWRHEYQADSFAGYVLRNLGGNAQPSLQIYSTVMAQWSSSHPPGQLRAQVFLDAYQSGRVTNFKLTSHTDSTLGGKVAEAIAGLKHLSLARDVLIAEGYNPYLPSSDARLVELLAR